MPSVLIFATKLNERYLFTFLKLDDYDLEYEAISIDTQPCAVNAYCLE